VQRLFSACLFCDHFRAQVPQMPYMLPCTSAGQVMPATSVQAAAATAALAQLPLVLGMPTWNGYSENGWLKKEATRNGSHDPLMLLGGVAAASAPAQNGDGSKHGR